MPNMKQPTQGPGGDKSDTASSNLWVGNLTPDVTESDLTELFGKFGVLDEVTCYSSRSYAFIYFRRVDDAAAAKNALQGSDMRGNILKIEFAKRAKPSKHLWVGGFGPSLTREKLEEELKKFGEVEEIKLLRDRNTAFIDYARIEDASAAVKGLNGKQIGGDHIRVDFLRSHPARREPSDFRDSQFRGTGHPDPSWISQESMGNFSEPSYSGHKRQQPAQSFGGRKDAQPSKILWVGYPPSVVMDEELLYNAMIPYGEIERIKCFRERHYSFVEFRSIEEASKAKESLQGRLFNDPRISIMFSCSGLAPGKEFTAPYSGFRGPRSNMYMNDGPFRPPLVDVFPHNRAIAPNDFPGGPPSSGVLGPGVIRPFGPRGGLINQPEFNDPMLHNVSNFNPTGPVGLNQKRLSPAAAGLLPSPGPTSRVSQKTSGWDVRDPSQIPREPKRSRVDGSFFQGAAFASGDGDTYVTGMEYEGGRFGPPGILHGNSQFTPIDVGVAGGSIEARTDSDYIWRGVIAKGGTPVCQARCIPIGKGIECELPEVVNCSARTGLDMLTKHYQEAAGFDIVFFLPDSEDDFASYTEFLRYLGSKNRAGVVKLDDGTTLFLVPPSDFLTNVLSVAGPERLYGVVLKLAQPPANAPMLQQAPPSIPPHHHMDQQQAPPMHNEYGAAHRDQVLPVDYRKVMHEEAMLSQRSPLLPRTDSTSQPAPHGHANSSSAASRVGATLTPELIATLSSLLPSSTQPLLGQSAQLPLSSASTTASALTSLDRANSALGWNQQYQTPELSGQPPQLLGNQLNSQAQLSTNFQAYPSISNVNNQPAQVYPESMQMQNYQMPQQGSVSSRPHLMLPETMQNQNFLGSAQTTQQYQAEVPFSSQQGYVTSSTAASYGPLEIQQQQKSISSLPNQVPGVNFSLPENASTGVGGQPYSGPPSQLEGHQPMGSVAGQSTSEVVEDKSQRYQSTLQFAASLLQQLQQQHQQPSSSQMGPGFGNQQ